MFGNNKHTGKFGKIVRFVSLGLTIKATVWDKMTPAQKQRLIVAAKEAAHRTKAQGFDTLGKFKTKKSEFFKKGNSTNA